LTMGVPILISGWPAGTGPSQGRFFAGVRLSCTRDELATFALVLPTGSRLPAQASRDAPVGRAPSARHEM
jgi:hypothetical protein